jgi:hypothetical protein
MVTTDYEPSATVVESFEKTVEQFPLAKTVTRSTTSSVTKSPKRQPLACSPNRRTPELASESSVMGMFSVAERSEEHGVQRVHYPSWVGETEQTNTALRCFW